MVLESKDCKFDEKCEKNIPLDIYKIKILKHPI